MSKRTDEHHAIETQLRELCAWYEWSSNPKEQEVAPILQDAADALARGVMTTKAARMLLDAWKPFAGLEAEAEHRGGKAIDAKLTALKRTEDLGLLREAAKQIADRAARVEDPALKAKFSMLHAEQMAIYRKAARK